jgi:glycine hydroxymethyltransferase
MARGHKLVTDGTDNHLLLMNVRNCGLTGSKMEKMCDQIHITLNKNTILGDKSAVTPGGVRIGTPAVTTRGYVESDMREVARFLDEAIKLSVDIQSTAGAKLKDFEKAIENDGRVVKLANEVESFATQFDIPGFSTNGL